MSTAGTLEKYRVTVCFFLDHSSNKNTRILVPCQESWTINRLKEEAIRRLKKNLTPSYHDTDGDKTKRQDEIVVKHIENLSKDILDGDDLIRDVLDNKEILVARLEGDEDIDFFNNDYLIRGSMAGSVAGDSIHSSMLPSGHAYPESIQLPLRAETEIGTPERHPPYYHHSYYSHDRRHGSIQYPLQDDFMGEIHPPPPRSFASGYAYTPATDYEMPRIQPRYSYCRPDSCNSDIPHTSDSSNFMNAAQSRSPSVLSEENRVGHSAMPVPYHSHALSNPENYPSDETSPLIGITSGDSGYSNHSIPLPLYPRSIPGHTEDTPSLSLPLAECPIPSPRNYSPSSEPTSNTDRVESPTLSPPPVPFGRKYRPSVMHGYINPDPEPMQEMNPIIESPITEEEPTPHEPLSKTSSNDSKPGTPKVTLRLRSRVRPPNKEASLSIQKTGSPSSITLTTSSNDVTALVDVPADCLMSNNADVQENSAPVEVSAERIVTPPPQLQYEQQIDKVIETAIELPGQRPMDVIVKVTKEARNHSHSEDSPALPQKRAKTSSSPPPTTVTPLNPTLPVEATPIPPSTKPETPVMNQLTTPTNTHPEDQSPDVSKSTSMVGGNRSIGAKFIVELEKGSGGLGFGIKSRDTAADGMTYPHFVSSIKPGGVAEADGRIKKGDLLLEVNGIDVTSMRHVLCLDYMRKQRGRVMLKISRQDKSRQAGDPDGGSYSEARIDDDRREEEATMDLVASLVSEVLKEPSQAEQNIEVETTIEVDTLEPSIQSIAASNTSLDELSPHQSREFIDEIGSKQEKRRSSSIQSLLKQAALTDTIIFTPRGKKVQPLLIPLTEAGLGVSVRGKTRMNTDNKSHEGGIYVKLIVPGGAADKDGRLKPNDQILSINGCVLVGQSNQEAMKTLKQGLDRIEQPEIKLVVLKKLPIASRSGKRGQRPQDNMYSRKLSLGSKNSTGYANSQLPSIYHPICMEDLQKNGEGKVFSVLDAHPDLDASRDKSSASPPADYESLTQGHIYEQLDSNKRRGKRSPSDVSKFRTAIQISTEEDEHIYARPQRRNTEEGIYTRANRVVYGRVTAGNKSQSADSPMIRTPTYTEEIYAQPSMSKVEKSKKNRESIYESLLMVKPKYGEGVFKRKPREHLYECVTDIFDDQMSHSEDNSDFSALNRPVASAVNNPYEINRSLEIIPTQSDIRNPALSTAAKSMSLQKTPSGGDTMQSMFPTGRSTPRGTRNVTSSRAVPHAPISSTKRPRSRTGRIQYPNPVDLSPYFTTVQQQQLTGKQERIPIPLTEPPVRSTLPDSEIYKTTIREVSQGPTPVSTPHRPVPESPDISTPFEVLSPVDLTFASEQDDSLGPTEFKREGQGRDDVSERHPFAKDAKQLNAYKDIQIKLAEEKLKSMQQPSPAQTQTHPMSLDLDLGKNFHMQLGGSVSTPSTDKQKEKLAASKKGGFFGRFKKKKTNKEKNLRDTPSPLLDSYPPSADDIDTYTGMMPPDDN